MLRPYRAVELHGTLRVHHLLQFAKGLITFIHKQFQRAHPADVILDLTVTCPICGHRTEPPPKV
jgi:hypothetical protein